MSTRNYTAEAAIEYDAGARNGWDIAAAIGYVNDSTPRHTGQGILWLLKNRYGSGCVDVARDTIQTTEGLELYERLRDPNSVYQPSINAGSAFDEPEVDPVDKERERQQRAEQIRTLSELHRSEAKRRDYIKAIRETLPNMEPIPYREITVHDRGKMSIHKWVITLSDWHIGQKTPIAHTGGLYEQNLGITQWQVDRLLYALKSIHEVNTRGQIIEEVMVLVEGDIVDGDAMRPSQLRAIDIPVTEQALEAYRLLRYFMTQVAAFPGVKRVVAHVVGGNHDRTSARPGNAGLGETDYVDTYAWLMGSVLKESFRDDPRLDVEVWDTFFGYTIFAGQRFVFEHGASFKTSSGSYGGVGWYPILNAAGKYKDMLDGADIVSMGHFHVPAVLPTGRGGWVIVNGALPATTHWVQATFKSIRHPTQWLLDFHEDHGLVAPQPLYAIPDTLLGEGEAWKQAAEKSAALWTPR